MCVCVCVKFNYRLFRMCLYMARVSALKNSSWEGGRETQEGGDIGIYVYV